MSGEKILIVEDAPDLALAMTMELSDQGFEVRMAHNGAQAMEEIAQETPDLAILDMQLPDTTGVALCEAIRKSHTIPVIIFSGVNSQATVLEAIQRGATDYVLKGSGLAMLTARVRQHLGKAPLPRETPAAVTAGPLAGPPAGAPDGRKQILLVEPDEAAQASLVEILTYLGYRVVPATSGAEARQVFAKSRPQIVMVALDSPGADGLKLVQDIRASGNSARVGFMGISRKLSPEAVRRAKYHGLASFVSRPWNASRIHHEMQQAIDSAVRAAGKAA